MLSEHYLTVRRSICSILILFIYGSEIFAKNCEDICGKGEEPSPDLTDQDELSQCIKPQELKSTK